MEERLVRFRPRTVLVVLGIVLAGVVVLEVVRRHERIVIWILVAIFLALALNPAVEWLQRAAVLRGAGGGGLTSSAILVIVGDRRDVHPDARLPGQRVRRTPCPDYIDEITKGRGRLGFLEAKYQLVDKAQRGARQGRRDEAPRALRRRRSR